VSRDPQTEIGAGNAQFPPTTWSLVQNLSERGSREEAFQGLCQRYWRPIYCYVRRAWRKGNEDAKDTTQAFFAWLVSGDVLARFDPSQGHFRYYLKGLLRNFVLKQEAAGRALKRGGGAAPLELGALEQAESVLPPSDADSPEEAFDRQFVSDLLDAALARTRARCEAAGALDSFRAFELYELGAPGTKPTYASVADELEVSPNVVRHRLGAVRAQIQVELRALLRETVSSPEQFATEWAALFG
jgi:RNA polymerase sigma factor (sigma-70 family)